MSLNEGQRLDLLGFQRLALALALIDEGAQAVVDFRLDPGSTVGLWCLAHEVGDRHTESLGDLEECLGSGTFAVAYLDLPQECFRNPCLSCKIGQCETA